MVISFCGHADFLKNEKYEETLINFLKDKVGNRHADLLLGGYGSFDAFAYDCAKKYQNTHPNVSLVYVTPYLDNEKNLRYQSERYDMVLYPELELVPKKLAIVYRNRFMINKADVVVAYVSHSFGGAYGAYIYAKKIGKEIFNLAECHFE